MSQTNRETESQPKQVPRAWADIMKTYKVDFLKFKNSFVVVRVYLDRAQTKFIDKLEPSINSAYEYVEWLNDNQINPRNLK